MYKLEKKTIEGLSPLIVTNATKDNAEIIPKGYTKQDGTPTPDNPIRIRNIGDNINLSSGIKAGLYQIANGEYASSDYYVCSQDKIKVNSNSKIAISNKENKKGIYYILELDKDGNYIKSQNSSIAVYDYICTIGENTKYILVDIGYKVEPCTIENVGNFKVEYNVATPYTEYGCGSIDYEIKNKNKLRFINVKNYKFITQTINGVTITNNEDGTFTLNGTSTDTISKQLSDTMSKLKAGDYYLSRNSEGSVTGGVFQTILWVSNDTNNPIRKAALGSEGQKVVIDKYYENYYLWLYISAGITFNNYILKPQLEKGEIKTDWEIYKEQIIDFPLNEGQLLHEGDYLAEDGIHQNKKTLVLDGTEEGWIYNNITGFSISNETNYKKYKDGGKCISSHYEYIAPNTQNSIWIGNNDFLFINDTRFSSVAEFKVWLAEQYSNGTPVTVEYELAEEVIIPLTSEQQDVIDNIELFEGYNEISSLDEFDFEMRVNYTPQFTDDIKKAFRTGIVKEYLEVLDENLIIDYDNYLKDTEFSELRFVPDIGIFGQAVAKKISVNLNNTNNSLNLQDKDIRAFIETEVNGEKYRIRYGDFIIQHPENENANDNTSLIGLDYMIKANIKYVDTMEYPCTLKELAKEVCTQAGLILANENFRNQDFIVENNQFQSGESCRQILQAIALSAFSWVRVDENNKVHFDFKTNFDVAETINYDNYYNLDIDSEEYGPINRIIIRNSQIEGENVTISDDDSIAQYGANELVISDNPFAYTQEKREQLIEAGKELYGFRYLPINSSKLTGYIYLNCLDKVKFKDMQNNEAETYIFNHIIEYNGACLDTVETPAMTKTETKYIFTPTLEQAIKNTQVIVDKANQRIISVVEKQDEQSNQLVNITTDLAGVHTTIQDNQKDIEEKLLKIEQTIEGTSQTLSTKGGNNILCYSKEFWTDGTETGKAKLEEYTNTEIQQKSISGNGYIINSGTSEQKVNVKNDTYTISFTYKRNVALATGYILINNERINLTSSEWKEETITLNIDTATIDLKIVSDTNNAFELFDLMGAIGNEKQIWTQNPNETRTDTVTIGKGIQVKSSSKNTYARFDADGNRIFNNSTGEVVTALTDKGVETDEVNSNTTKTGGILIQKQDNQTWISSLL